MGIYISKIQITRFLLLLLVFSFWIAVAQAVSVVDEFSESNEMVPYTRNAGSSAVLQPFRVEMSGLFVQTTNMPIRLRRTISGERLFITGTTVGGVSIEDYPVNRSISSNDYSSSGVLATVEDALEFELDRNSENLIDYSALIGPVWFDDMYESGDSYNMPPGNSVTTRTSVGTGKRGGFRAFVRSVLSSTLFIVTISAALAGGMWLIMGRKKKKRHRRTKWKVHY